MLAVTTCRPGSRSSARSPICNGTGSRTRNRDVAPQRPKPRRDRGCADVQDQFRRQIVGPQVGIALEAHIERPGMKPSLRREKRVAAAHLVCCNPTQVQCHARDPLTPAAVESRGSGCRGRTPAVRAAPARRR